MWVGVPSHVVGLCGPALTSPLRSTLISRVIGPPWRVRRKCRSLAVVPHTGVRPASPSPPPSPPPCSDLRHVRCLQRARRKRAPIEAREPRVRLDLLRAGLAAAQAEGGVGVQQALDEAAQRLGRGREGGAGRSREQVRGDRSCSLESVPAFRRWREEVREGGMPPNKPGSSPGDVGLHDAYGCGGHESLPRPRAAGPCPCRDSR